MIRNHDRRERILDQLRRARLDAFVCTFAAHVVMLTGYWPVVGTSIAIATRDGTIALLVPEDEKRLTESAWADIVETYAPESLDSMSTPAQSVTAPLRSLLRKLGLHSARMGYEHGPVSEPASYASVHIFGASILDILARALPEATLDPADQHLESLDSVKTPVEVERISTACEIAARAFEAGVRHLTTSITETEAACVFRDGLSRSSPSERAARADGFAFCMSGPNSAHAYGAFAQTGHRKIEAGDLVLIHCNSYADGYWTDITRTYQIGKSRFQKWRAAIAEARAAALAAIGPGVQAAAVDRAAREVLLKHGLAHHFLHSTGHGVGFAAISANARPRLHPRSPDILEEGMVFNVEPAVYVDGMGGMRHCDMVCVEAKGARVLTNFQLEPSEVEITSTLRAA